MFTIDAQVHAYERNHAGRPWVGTLEGPSEVTGDQMVAGPTLMGGTLSRIYNWVPMKRSAEPTGRQ
jgi:hypothetical protein